MADTTTTQVQTNIPDYIRPYVENQLGRVQALTDINQNPYQSYGGQRIAGPTALQQQSYGAAQGMQPSAYTGQAGYTAGQVAQRAGQVSQYAPGQFNPMMTSTQGWSPEAMRAYMSPYQQGVTDIAKREALRQSNIRGTYDDAAATGMGAYGGSRQAIMDAERERNLGMQMNDIQMQGDNAAYTNAQQMFTNDMGRGLQSQVANQGAGLQGMQLGEQSRQFGANLGLQGLQTQLGAAGMMKDVGQSQYNQNVGIAGLQNQFGTQQQMTNQAGADYQYQDFLNQQAWPYKNEEFMYNIMRGLPMANTTQTLNTPSPSPLSQMIGAGTALYGFNSLMNKPAGNAGGGVIGYAGGGITSLGGQSSLGDDETYLVPYDELSRGKKQEMDLDRRRNLEQTKKDYAPRSTTERVITNVLTQHPLVPQNMREESARLSAETDSRRAARIQAAQDEADYKDVKGGRALYGDDVPHKMNPKRKMFAGGGNVSAGLADLLIAQIA
jgi:hypothetical protein